MIEKEMDDRGSKSAAQTSVAVKEQRVDGSWQVGGASCLRCTLMGFERNYQVKIPFKQINMATLTTLPLSKIDPWFLTGFADCGELFFSFSSK